MDKVTVDADGTAKVSATTAVDVCDESGVVVGHYLPLKEFERLRYEWLPAHSPEKVAEAFREVMAGGGYTTAQVLESLDRARQRCERLKRLEDAP